jgi:hypothetical protein
MHVHLPKPMHGWRQFAGEVGIIVLGVLIALTAEQVVNRVHERSQISEFRRALRGELADSRARWEDMRAGHDCANQRLDAIEQWLRTAGPRERLIGAYSPMLWNMHSSAWDLAKTSAVAEQIPLQERLLYASLYSAIDNWREYLNEERENAVQLNALLATADVPQHRADVGMRIDVARQYLTRRKRNYPYFFVRLDQLRIAPDATQLTVSHDPRDLCSPLNRSTAAAKDRTAAAPPSAS